MGGSEAADRACNIGTKLLTKANLLIFGCVATARSTCWSLLIIGLPGTGSHLRYGEAFIEPLHLLLIRHVATLQSLFWQFVPFTKAIRNLETCRCSRCFKISTRLFYQSSEIQCVNQHSVATALLKVPPRGALKPSAFSSPANWRKLTPWARREVMSTVAWRSPGCW